MIIYWIYLFVGLMAAGLALATTPIVKSLALNCKQVDTPCERTVHERPTVRLGGAVIFLSTVFLFTVLSLLGGGRAGGMGYFSYETPAIISSVTVAVLVGLGIILAQPVLALLGVDLLGVALLGSLLGFLPYSYNLAAISVGDGGAYFIGFILASLYIISPQFFKSPFATILPLVILAVPLGDMTGVILARLYRGLSPFNTDNLHLHHRLLQRDLSHRGTVWIVYVLTMASGCLSLALAGFAYRWLLAIGSLGLLWMVVWQIRQFPLPITKSPDVFTRKGLWYLENL